MSRTVIPPEYSPRILSSKPASRVAPLGQDLRLKAALAVARRFDLDGPQVALHRLRRVPVADVRAVRDTAGRMAEMVGHLVLQRGLHDPAGQLRQQTARTR